MLSRNKYLRIADPIPATNALFSTKDMQTSSNTKRVGDLQWITSLFIFYYLALSCSPKPGPDLQTMCRTIPGDAPLYTLFRVDTQSIRCPIQGPLHFSYNFGRGLCAYPLSKLESCTLDTRISLKYQACPNVPGSEMKGITVLC